MSIEASCCIVDSPEETFESLKAERAEHEKRVCRNVLLHVELKVVLQVIVESLHERVVELIAALAVLREQTALHVRFPVDLLELPLDDHREKSHELQPSLLHDLAGGGDENQTER